MCCLKGQAAALGKTGIFLKAFLRAAGLSAMLAGCTLGTHHKGYEKLTQATFPSFKQIPRLTPQEQAQSQQRLKQAYVQEKKALEAARNQLTTQPRP